jgi:aspartate/methionine/tyrosine aminotransferase
MHYRFADRLSHAPKSFLDELFRVSADPSIISFAGGFPSSAMIDTEGIQKATCEVMEEDPATALQYTTTDGYLPLREFIADRYRSRLGIPATATEIQIVNGSQRVSTSLQKYLSIQEIMSVLSAPATLVLSKHSRYTNWSLTRLHLKMMVLIWLHSRGSYIGRK